MLYNHDNNFNKNTIINRTKNNSSKFLKKQPFFLYSNKNNNLNNYIKDSNIEFKDNEDFLKKYKNNIEFMGHTGIRGLVKSTGNSLLKNKSNILPLINSYNFNSNKLDNFKNSISLNNYNINYKQNNDFIKKNNNVIIIPKNFEVFNIDNERGYKPHSYKDFKKIMKDYKNNRFGGLGENSKTLEWYQKAKNYKLKKDYSNNLSKHKIGIKNYINDSIYEANINLQIKNLNSKRYKTIKYGKGVMLNKVRDVIRKQRLKEIEQLEMEKKQYEYLQKKQLYEQFLARDKEIYIQNLKKLKESLLFD